MQKEDEQDEIKYLCSAVRAVAACACYGATVFSQSFSWGTFFIGTFLFYHVVFLKKDYISLLADILSTALKQTELSS